MSATRTQIYLTEEQRSRIDRAAEAEGVTMAELIRRAVDQYLAHDSDPQVALASTFGADPQREGLRSSSRAQAAVASLTLRR